MNEILYKTLFDKFPNVYNTVSDCGERIVCNELKINNDLLYTLLTIVLLEESGIAILDDFMKAYSQLLLLVD